MYFIFHFVSLFGFRNKNIKRQFTDMFDKNIEINLLFAWYYLLNALPNGKQLSLLFTYPTIYFPMPFFYFHFNFFPCSFCFHFPSNFYLFSEINSTLHLSKDVVNIYTTKAFHLNMNFCSKWQSDNTSLY